MSHRMFARANRNPSIRMFNGDGSSGDGVGAGSSGTGSSGDGEGGGGNEGSDDADKTFTQAELETKIEERLRRERQKYGDYDELKRKAEAHDTAAREQLTEHEKALETARTEARDQAMAEGQQERFADKVEAIAAKAGFADTEDAVLRMRTRFDEFKPSNGQFDTSAIEAALKALLKDKPHLAAKQQSDEKNGRVSGGARQTGAVDDASPGIGRLRSAYSDSSK